MIKPCQRLNLAGFVRLIRRSKNDFFVLQRISDSVEGFLISAPDSMKMHAVCQNTERLGVILFPHLFQKEIYIVTGAQVQSSGELAV